MEHRPQIVAAAIRSEENVVDVRSGDEEATHVDHFPFEHWFERKEGFVVGEDDDDRRHGGGGDGRGEDARQGLAKSFELPANLSERRLTLRPENDEIRRVEARPSPGPRKADERSSPSGSATGSG